MTSLETWKSSLKEQRSIFSFLYPFWVFHHFYGLLFSQFPHLQPYFVLLGKQTRNNRNTNVKAHLQNTKFESQYLCFVNAKIWLFFFKSIFSCCIFKHFSIFFGMSNMDFTNYLSGERKKQKLPVYFISLLFTKACNTKHFTVWLLVSTIPRYRFYTLLPRLHLTQYTNFPMFRHLFSFFNKTKRK